MLFQLVNPVIIKIARPVVAHYAVALVRAIERENIQVHARVRIVPHMLLGVFLFLILAFRCALNPFSQCPIPRDTRNGAMILQKLGLDIGTINKSLAEQHMAFAGELKGELWKGIAWKYAVAPALVLSYC